MRKPNCGFVILTIALLALSIAGTAWGQSVRWNADGTKSLTQETWTLAGNPSDGLTKSNDFSNGQADTGSDGVWHINDNNSPSAAYMRMYKDPGGLSSQGIVMARARFIAASASISGTFGYSYASGNHSVVMAIRGGQINWKTAESDNMVPAPVSVDTSVYRVYALRWYSDGSFDAWYSNTTDWSSNQSDWTQVVSGGRVDTGISQTALIDHNSVARTGLLLGSFGTSTISWEGNVDYIAWSNNSGEWLPWNFNPLPTQPDDSQYVSDTIPSAMGPGQQYSVSVTLKNSGSNTWTAAAGYKLGAVGDSDPFCAFNRVDLAGGDSIAQNQQKTFSFTMTGPSTPGTYTTDWRMIHEGIGWFGYTLTKQIAVLWPDSAQYISDTIPATMNGGQQYNVSVTMRNTSQNTWTLASGCRLGAVDDSDPFYSEGRVDLGPSESIGPDQQKTFSFTMTAPSSAGTYTTDWRMVRESLWWFGDTLTKQVEVAFTGPPPGLLLDDPLQGSTSGTRQGGQFVTGGWKVTGTQDWIFWHLPYTVSHGAAEFYIIGLNSRDSRPTMYDKTELWHMYDYTYGNADYQYNGGYRENPYKHFIRKNGVASDYNNTTDACEVLWATPTEYYEADTPVLSWNAANNYHFRVEWGPDGQGNSVLKIYRDGVLVLERGVAGQLRSARPQCQDCVQQQIRRGFGRADRCDFQLCEGVGSVHLCAKRSHHRFARERLDPEEQPGLHQMVRRHLDQVSGQSLHGE
ncbi:MAG: NBR1-Ig-like domain-containing protein [Armatimonadota bacterium]|nr:NBR1-Ig-like domain-containing protein [Armatimonadota bacterium]